MATQLKSQHSYFLWLAVKLRNAQLQVRAYGCRESKMKKKKACTVFCVLSHDKISLQVCGAAQCKAAPGAWDAV